MVCLYLYISSLPLPRGRHPHHSDRIYARLIPLLCLDDFPLSDGQYIRNQSRLRSSSRCRCRRSSQFSDRGFPHRPLGGCSPLSFPRKMAQIRRSLCRPSLPSFRRLSLHRERSSPHHCPPLDRPRLHHLRRHPRILV